MDVKRSKLNVGISLAFKMLTMIVSLLTRRALIVACGNDINGLNSLYLSIIGILSVVELGIGNAIIFCMYKPIVEGDVQKVGALYRLFKKAYMVVGAIIFVGGVCTMPFLKILAKDYQELDTNLYITFLLILISVVTTYLFSAKTSLINAYKDNYITTTISQGGLLFQHIIQIVVLFITRSFVLYLLCRILTVAIQYIATELVVRFKHSEILKQKSDIIDTETKDQLKKSISAMFMHKLGSVLVNTVDSVVISAFLGVVVLGEYSNYAVIMSAIMGIITMIFTSLTSIVGHLYVEEERDVACQYCEVFHFINYIIAMFVFLGYYAVIDNIIALLFSPSLIVSKEISFVITFNGFIQYMRQTVLVFKDATGTFYNDRWKPLIEGLFNIVLSVLLINCIGVIGVIVATIITNLLICHIVEPYVLYKNAFSKSVKFYYIRNYCMILSFFFFMIVLNAFKLSLQNVWGEFWVNGLISIGCSFFACGVFFILNKKYVLLIKRIFRKR